MAKSSETRAKQVKHKKYMLVSYGRMGTLGLFEHQESAAPKTETRVVVKTARGLELGHLVGRLTSYKGGQFRLSEEQMIEYFEGNEVDFPRGPAGKVIRYATAADISEERHLRKIVKEEMECCRRIVREMKLPMKIVDAEHLFGGERIVFYFMSDGRVDFRELVRKVAQEYQTRIEMRQIGSRDEAKLRLAAIVLPVPNIGAAHPDQICHLFLVETQVESPGSDVVAPGVQFGRIAVGTRFLAPQLQMTSWQ